MTLTVATRWTGRLAALLLMLAALLQPRLLAAQEPGLELNLLLLKVRLDQSVLSSAIPAYDRDGHTLLPMGEVARLLTIAVQTQPLAGTASGFVLSQDRSFSLSVADARVSRAGKFEGFDPQLVMQEPDDIYVASSLLERWFPIEFTVDRSSQVLKVKALEELPLQARLRRERLAERFRHSGGYEAPQYPFFHSPYRVLDTPFIDQTLTSEAGKKDGQRFTTSRYSAYLTGDFLGLESTVYLAADTETSNPEVRAILGRHNPDGHLLGPMNARSYQFGSFSSPNIENVLRASIGEGFSVSNRSLTQPTQFDSQTFEGNLPPGWDVELYYNNTLVAYQQVGTDGRYRFEDLPLSYGRNDFQLIFNGPLGQTRVENFSYPLDQSMTRAGEFRYDMSGHRDEEGNERLLAQFDVGLLRNLSASAAFMEAPIDGVETSFSRIGLRTFWESMSLNGAYTGSDDGGYLGEIGLQTRLAGISVDGSRVFINDFISDEFFRSADPVVTRDEVRLTASPALGDLRLPMTLEYERDTYDSGFSDTRITSRLSTYAFRTAVTNVLDWRSVGRVEQTTGTFLLSRRLYGIGLRGSIDYRLSPMKEVSAVALTADYSLAEGYRLNFGVHRDIMNLGTTLNFGLSKTIGRFALGVNGRYADDGNYAFGLQFSLGLGREPKASHWVPSAQSMAGLGAASVRMFVDENGNGTMDTGEEPVSDAGFVVNGSRREVRTNENGIALLGKLPVERYVDVSVDRSTLFDPMWEPAREGVSLVPRPGHVARVDFPVQMTTEIDGTVYLWAAEAERGIGGVKLELLDEKMNVVSKATTAWDGFYIVPRVPSGDYYLRASPEQLDELELRDTGVRVLEVAASEGYISGVDMLVQRPQARTASPPRYVSERRNQHITRAERSADAGDWIAQQPGGNFTIQLIAASNPETVKAFMRKHNIVSEAAYFESQFQGQPWFSLVYGSYESLSAATRALRDLPPSFKYASPWIRQFQDIHQAAGLP
jgi:hypothetical protein